jgi:hypothetical protein
MRLFIYIAILSSVTSCKPIHLSERVGKDIFLDSESNALNGIYINNLTDTLSSGLYSFWQRINNKNSDVTVPNTAIQIKTVTSTSLKISLVSNNQILADKIIEGKYKSGYFKLKNRFSADLIYGPFLWSLAGFKIYIGLTKEGNLALLESNAGSAMLLVLPFFPAGDKHTFVYKRKTVE